MEPSKEEPRVDVGGDGETREPEGGVLDHSPNVEGKGEEVSIIIEDASPAGGVGGEQQVFSSAVLVAALVVIGLAFVVVVGLRYIDWGSDAAASLSIAQLHELNLRGELPQDQGYVFKGFSFVKDQLWYSQYVLDSGVTYELALHYGPREVRDVPFNGSLNSRLRQHEAWYITFDPLNTDGYVGVSFGEVTKILANVELKKMFPSCARNETDACKERPIVNCDNPLNQTRAVIEVRNRGEPGVTVEGSCIVVTGTGDGLIQASERLIYEWLDVL